MFGITYTQSVQIVTGDGSHDHPYDHDLNVTLANRLRDRSEVVRIVDEQGIHLYPVRNIESVHFGRTPDRSHASVLLLQGKDHDRIYLRDPDTRHVWWITGLKRNTFAEVAAALVNGSRVLRESADMQRHPRWIDDLTLVATWRYSSGTDIEYAAGTDSVPVAGPAALEFLGTLPPRS